MVPRAVPWFKAFPKVRIVCIICRSFADSLTCTYLWNQMEANNMLICTSLITTDSHDTSLAAPLIVFRWSLKSFTWSNSSTKMLWSIYHAKSYKENKALQFTWLEKVILKANTRNLDSTRGTFISSTKNWST